MRQAHGPSGARLAPCVASLSRSSLAYDAGGNLETCDSIAK